MEITNGLIIRQSDYGDGNRMLMIFTEEYGIVKATIYGARKTRGRQSAASQFLCFGEFSLFFGKGDVATVNQINPIETFFPISEDLHKLAFASYLAEITYYSEGENSPNKSLLRLLLNTLYAVCYHDLPIKLAKAVYELRLVDSMGYRPFLKQCALCGKNEGLFYFSHENGGATCEACHGTDADKIGESVINIMRYIISADEKKVFSFKINQREEEILSKTAEKYFLKNCEKGFSSLDYLKKLLT